MACVFHEMTTEELEKQLELSRSELRELRFTFAVARSLQDPARVRKLKRNVAKILTVTRARQLGIVEQSSGKGQTDKKDAGKKESGKKDAGKKDTKKESGKKESGKKTAKEKK